MTAAQQAQRDTKLAALTRSEKGSVILGDGKSIAIPAAPVAKVEDTTGAGDLYAAGFLFGVASGKDLETAGRLGSLAAAEIISHIGARPAVKLGELARKQGHCCADIRRYRCGAGERPRLPAPDIAPTQMRLSATFSMLWFSPLRRIRRAR